MFIVFHELIHKMIQKHVFEKKVECISCLVTSLQDPTLTPLTEDQTEHDSESDTSVAETVPGEVEAPDATPTEAAKADPPLPLPAPAIEVAKPQVNVAECEVPGCAVQADAVPGAPCTF